MSHSSLLKPKSVQQYPEVIGLDSDLPSVTSKQPMDQLLFNDTSDYLWYKVEFSSPQEVATLKLDPPYETTHIYNQDKKYLGTCPQEWNFLFH